MPSLSDNVMELPSEFIERVDAVRSNLVVFSVMRNERQRIPAWLRHYREIGVKTFAIVDNNSTDGTYELLKCEKDVVLTRMAGGFLASRFGVDWLNEFHRRIRPGAWVLFVDADEFLVYRGWPETDLATYANWMTAEGSNAAMGFMLDMYPVGPIENATIVDSDDLFTVAGNFDRDYHFRVAPRKPWETGNGHLEVIGGPRVRLLSSFEKEISTTWWSYFIRGQIDRILPTVPDRFLGLLIRIRIQLYEQPRRNRWAGIQGERGIVPFQVFGRLCRARSPRSKSRRAFSSGCRVYYVPQCDGPTQ
jgi:hypothetical protein